MRIVFGWCCLEGFVSTKAKIVEYLLPQVHTSSFFPQDKEDKEKNKGERGAAEFTGRLLCVASKAKMLKSIAFDGLK